MWQSEVVPQLVADTDGRLQVLTLFTALCRRHPGRFQPGQRHHPSTVDVLYGGVRSSRIQPGKPHENGVARCVAADRLS